MVYMPVLTPEEWGELHPRCTAASQAKGTDALREWATIASTAAVSLEPVAWCSIMHDLRRQCDISGIDCPNPTVLAQLVGTYTLVKGDFTSDERYRLMWTHVEEKLLAYVDEINVLDDDEDDPFTSRLGAKKVIEAATRLIAVLGPTAFAGNINEEE